MSVRLAHALAGTNAATVSAAGTIQSDATLIAFDNNLITTASASQGVRLPSFNAGAIYIANGTAVDVFVYPPTGGKINNDTANDPVTLPAGAAGIFKAISPLDTLAVYGASFTIADNSVTFTKMQDIATQRAIGRNTAGTGDPEEVTLTQILDWIGSAAQGDILYRGASSWARLGAGTSGQFLQTQGTGANPQWTASGGLVSKAYASSADNSSLSATIPFDDSIPQITEGTEVLTVQVTPQSITNRVRLRFQAFGACSSVGNRAAAALFMNSTADALAATGQASVNTVAGLRFTLEFEHVPATLSTITYRIRVGPSASDGGTLRLNGTSAARLFGGVAVATLIAEAFTP